MAGGSLTSADGKVTLVVPPNAVNSDIQFTIDPANGFPPSSRIVGTVYDIEPTGTSFPANARPQLTINYGTLPAGVNPATVIIGTLANGQWVDISGSASDPGAQTVTALLEHLSPYAVLQPAADPPPSNQDPIASAGGPVYVGQVGAEVTFTAAGSSDPDDDPLTFTWTFGDSPQSEVTTEFNTSHIYASQGDYTVTLTASDGRGGSDTEQVVAEITDLAQNTAPVAHAGGPYEATVGQGVPFSAADSFDLDGDSLTYVWDFGDGVGSDVGMTPMYAYTSAGTWPVTVTVSDGRGGSDEDVTTAVIRPASSTNRDPVIASTTIPPPGLTNQVLLFDAVATDDDGHALTYRWNFGDGTITSFEPSPTASHAYSTAGIFTVTLTVDDGHSGQATASGTVIVTTAALPVAFSQTYPIYLRQSTDSTYMWLYAMTLGGSGVPPLRFNIVSFPTYRTNNPPAPMDLLPSNGFHQWWDPVNLGWRLECRTSPVTDQTCRPTTSSHVDLTNVDPENLNEVIVSPSGAPATVVYAPLKCVDWPANPRTDQFTFTVTDGTGLTSAPATISITVFPGVCKGGTH